MFCFDLAMILILVSSAIYQGDAISEAEDSLSIANSTSIDKQFCAELCPQGYILQHGSLCCDGLDFSQCEEKSKCKEEFIKDLQDKIASQSAWFYAIFGCLGFFLLNLIVILCLNLSLRRDLMREHAERRRNTIARLMHYANQLSLYLQEQRVRRRSLLTQSFIANDGDETCAVCLDSFEEKKVIRLNCGHLFHSECIGSWIQYKTTCPVCRAVQ